LRLDEALQTARDAGSILAGLVADMDGLKQVNDQFGHTAS
jgi:GGDEF domain-containing protein